MPLQPAKIHFNQQGTPVATEFDDVYFSNASGIQESEYVFVQNNQLPDRWHQCSKPHFTIAETGFGTGLNFLVTLKLFVEFRTQQPDHPLKRLYFISTEKFPIPKLTLVEALKAWPQLAEFAEALLEKYPILVAGNHRLTFFSDQVNLDLCLGDVQQLLPSLYLSHSALVDAWYLDGFAPSKNPQMWTASLFNQMARLSSTSATFATFTAAGIVKRGLAEAGFEVKKRAGFGRKRDMLAGSMAAKPEQQADGLFSRSGPAKRAQTKTIGIVGAGLAAACCAYALAKRGYKIQLFYQSKSLADAASGNRQGGFYPHLNATASIASQIHVSAFQFAIGQYHALLKQGQSFSHDWCGVFLAAFSQQVLSRQQKLIENQTWPADLVHWLDPGQASQATGVNMPYSGLFIPAAGWINPAELVEALITAASSMTELELFANRRLADANFSQNGCELIWQNDDSTQLDKVVFATGHESSQFSWLQGLPLRLVRGQVELVNSTNALRDLRTVVCHKGYLTPVHQGQHALGSTYVKQDLNCEYRLSEAEQNIQVLKKALPDCDWTKLIEASGQGRAAVRCSSPDHLPIVGAVPDFAAQRQQFSDLYKGLKYKTWSQAQDIANAFVLTGLGSRGLTTAPLLAEALACQISGEPLPLNQQLLAALNPNRFLIRELLRQTSVSN